MEKVECLEPKCSVPDVNAFRGCGEMVLMRPWGGGPMVRVRGYYPPTYIYVSRCVFKCFTPPQIEL